MNRAIRTAGIVFCLLAIGGIGFVTGIGTLNPVLAGGGGVVGLNGLDNAQAGMRQAISGRPVQTATSKAVESVTGSPLAGEGANLAIGLVGPGAVVKMATGSGLFASLKSVGSGAWNGLKNTGSSIKSWWKGTPTLKGGCFLAGTLVSRYCTDTIDHREFIAIENIKSGDLVWACNPRIGIWEPKIVLGTTSLLYEGDIIKITVNGNVIETTGTHPIWVVSGNDLENRAECTNLTDSDSTLTPQGRWVNARDIQTGDAVLSRTWNTVSVSKVEYRTEMVQVYNFIVDDFHSYAVGIGEILVHNQSSMTDAIAEHTIKSGHFQGKSPDEIKALIEATMKGKSIPDPGGIEGRILYYDSNTKIIVVLDGKGKGTMFRPDNFNQWIQDWRSGRK